MANLFQMDTVKYICCCGSLKPISFTYFCRHCLRLRCSYCVSHEVDSHFCPNCSENVPSAEAKMKKNRCPMCFDCPSCKQTLSIRAVTIDVDPDDSNPKKIYYMVCGVCRWSTREAGIEDATAVGGPWKEPEVPDADKMEELIEYFRMLGQMEKSAKEKKYAVPKAKFLAAGRHGVAHLLPKRSPLTNPDEMAKPIVPPPYIAPTVGVEDLPELPDEFYEEDMVAAKVTPISHRLNQVETQPRSYAELLPTHKQLMVKRSLRCRVCERNISKPEYSPASIKFKIQLNAYYHVPQVRLAAPFEHADVAPGQKAKVLLRLSNPTQFPTSLKFLPFSFVRLRKEDVVGEGGELPSLGAAKDSSFSSLDTASLTFTPQTQMIKEISVLPFRDEMFTINFVLAQPPVELVLPPKDETSDFDDFSETPDFNDDPNFVTWRKGNKATVALDIEKVKEWNPDDPPLLGLTIEYDYTNTIMPLDSKGDTSPQKVRIQAHLLIALDCKQL